MKSEPNYRKTREYRLWRAAVIRRDKVCRVCKSNKHREAHHLDSYYYFPYKRTDLENGVCLCKRCHIAFHTMYKKSFRQKCTKDDFENFMDLVEYIKKINKE